MGVFVGEAGGVGDEALPMGAFLDSRLGGDLWTILDRGIDREDRW